MTVKYLNGTKLVLLNIGLGLGTFIQVLDSSITNVAAPYIAGSMALAPDEGTWVITAFAASNAICLPLTGWLTDYFGRIRLFSITLFLFALASLFCGMATNLSTLIVFRIIQGAVAGAFMPLAQSLIITFNPPEKIGAALGFWGLIVVVAPTLGPVISGFITEEYSWPFIFFINVPICLISAFLVLILIGDQESAIIRNPIDWVGLVLLILGVGSLQIMLDRGRDLDWFNSRRIIALTVFSVISLGYFILWSLRREHRIIDFSILRDRNFLIGTFIISIGFLIYFSSTVTVPLWLQTQQNYTGFWAGLALTPVGIAPFFLILLVGKNLQKVDYRIWIALCFAFFAISFFNQSMFTTSVSLYDVMVPRFLQGIADTIFFLPIIYLAMENIPVHKYASATGLFHFFRTLIGSGFGTSLCLELWRRREILHHARLVEALDPLQVDTFLEHSNLPTEVVHRLLEKEVIQQAYMLSTNDLSWLGAWLFVCMMPLLFLAKKKHRQHNLDKLTPTPL